MNNRPVVSIRHITDRTGLDDVYKLRYQLYLKEGVIEPNPEQVLHDEFDGTPNSMIFGAYINNVLSASIRLHIVTPQNHNSPTYAAFPKSMEQLIIDSGLVIDPNRFIVSRIEAPPHTNLHLIMMTIPYLATIASGARFCVAPVRVEHAAFYQRLLGYRRIASEVRYPGLTSKLILLAADFHDVNEHARVLARNGFLNQTYSHEEMVVASVRNLIMRLGC